MNQTTTAGIDLDSLQAIEHAAQICESYCACDNGDDDEEINRILRNRAAQIRDLARHAEPSVTEAADDSIMDAMCDPPYGAQDLYARLVRFCRAELPLAQQQGKVAEWVNAIANTAAYEAEKFGYCAALASPAVPEGYKLVPMKLTPEMRAAARDKLGFTLMYEAAIEASPAVSQKDGAGSTANFCGRCGKRLGDGIHTCTPPEATTASASDVCAEMRALCSNCGGTGEVHRADGSYVGTCDCMFRTIDSPVPAPATTADVDDGELMHLFDCYGNARYHRLSDASEYRERFIAALARAPLHAQGPMVPLCKDGEHVWIDGEGEVPLCRCGKAPTDQAVVDKHLDAVLRASGSALRYYTMQKTLDDMRSAMRAAMSASQDKEPQ